MVLIGITGTNGSGKGTVVRYLVAQKGFRHYAARAFLTDELVKRGLSVDRSSMRLLANEFRLQYEPAYVIRQLFEQAKRDECDRVVIESVRNVGEAVFLKEQGALLIAVDADQRLRYARVEKRRSSTDHVDFATFLEHEEREMNPVGSHDMDIRGVMLQADVTIENNGTIEVLHEDIERALNERGI